MNYSAQDVKDLREMTGAGMMDCKKALEACNGDKEKAVVWLREKGMASMGKRAHRVASEGAVRSYIHMGGKVGVLVEVNCETDFVARGENFLNFCQDICLQICAAAPRYVSRDEVSAEEIAAEKSIYAKQAKETGKPDNICEKIVEGNLKKWFKEVCLLEQAFVKDPDKSIESLVAELTAKVGEKISVRRFARFQLGEGIAKPSPDSAESKGN